jgi:hypothetical protein
MCVLMYHQSYLLHEWLITHTTGKWMLLTVCSNIPTSQLMESVHLLVAWIYYTSQVNGHPPLRVCWSSFRLICCVNDLLDTPQVNECFPLCALIYPQMTWLCEWFITHITGVCFPATTQITLLLVCCAVYMIWTWKSHIMYELMFIRSIVLKKIIRLNLQWRY